MSDDVTFIHSYGDRLRSLAREAGTSDTRDFLASILERYAAVCIGDMLVHRFVLWGPRYYRVTEWADMELQEPADSSDATLSFRFDQGLPPRTAEVLERLVETFPGIGRSAHLHRLVLVAVELHEYFQRAAARGKAR